MIRCEAGSDGVSGKGWNDYVKLGQTFFTQS